MSTRQNYTREILTVPDSLVADGEFNLGTFSRQFRILNPLDVSPFLIPLPRALKNIRLKEWQAYEMGNSEFFIFTVLYKAKSIALAQFIVYDRIRKEKFLYEKIVPSFQISLPSLCSASTGSYKDKKLFIEYNNETGNGGLNLKLSAKNFRNLPDVNIEINGIYNPEKWNPIVVCMPFSARRAMYSHKCLMPMQGNMEIADRTIDFREKESFMIIDDHKGYYPYSSFYDWVTGISSNGKGGLVGFNLTHNQILNKEKFNENCLWINGRLSLLPPVSFSRPDGPAGEWFIKDSYGMVDLKFVPEVHGEVNVNLFILKSYYQGPLGTFYGRIKDSSGKSHSMDGIFGMGEEKRLRM